MSGDLAGKWKPLPKEAQLARGPRRYRRKVASAKTWAQLYDAKTGPCRICGVWPTTLHHVVPKGSPWFGDDVEDNLVPLCGTGTTGCHGKVEARDSETCRRMLAALDDREYAAMISSAGEVFAERYYRLTYSR